MLFFVGGIFNWNMWTKIVRSQLVGWREFIFFFNVCVWKFLEFNLRLSSSNGAIDVRSELVKKSSATAITTIFEQKIEWHLKWISLHSFSESRVHQMDIGHTDSIVSFVFSLFSKTFFNIMCFVHNHEPTGHFTT